MAVITPTPKTQFIGADGVPLAGGKVYTYAAGTTTPQPTYTDSTGNTANPNPIILDARGEANIWLGEATYKFRLTDSVDVEIWTVDYISAPTTAVSPVLSGNVTISTNSSGPALKITQTGSGFALRVQGLTDPDLTPFVITQDGKVGILTAAPAEALDIDDNGKIQFSASGTARTIISADATNSTFDVSDNRNFVVKTNGGTRVTVSGAGATTLAGALTVSSGGANITGNSSVTGTLSATGNISTSAGNITATAGNITATAGSVTAGTTMSVGTTLSVDTIAEKTSGSGVTIDGVLLKDGITAASSVIISSGTLTATTSGTSVEFTGIPTWVKRVSVLFNGVSLSNSDSFLVQIGPSGGVATTGYTATAGVVVNNGGGSVGSSTSGFNVFMTAAGDAFRGIMTISLMDASTYLYAASHSGSISSTQINTGGGNVTLSGLLTRVKIISAATGTFDAGSVNILYE